MLLNNHRFIRYLLLVFACSYSNVLFNSVLLCGVFCSLIGCISTIGGCVSTNFIIMLIIY